MPCSHILRFRGFILKEALSQTENEKWIADPAGIALSGIAVEMESGNEIQSA